MRKRAHLHQLTVQMEHISAACTLMQIVDILRDDMHIKVLFKLFKPIMRSIRLNVDQFVPQVAVETVNQSRVAPKAIGTRYLHHRIVVPQATCIAISSHTTLGTHSGTGRNHQFLLFRFHNSKKNIYTKVEQIESRSAKLA